MAAEEYGGRNAVEAETGILLYGLVRRMSPKVVVEAGTHWGWSGGWIASALADNCTFAGQRGHLWTIDGDSYDGRAETLWDRLRVRDFVTHSIGCSWEWVPELPGPIDMLWLDADHSAQAIENEWDHFHDRLADPSMVCLHDTFLDVRMHEGIEKIKTKATWAGWIVHHTFFRDMRGFDALWLHKLGPRHQL